VRLSYRVGNASGATVGQPACLSSRSWPRWQMDSCGIESVPRSEGDYEERDLGDGTSCCWSSSHALRMGGARYCGDCGGGFLRLVERRGEWA